MRVLRSMPPWEMKPQEKRRKTAATTPPPSFPPRRVPLENCRIRTLGSSSVLTAVATTPTTTTTVARLPAKIDDTEDRHTSTTTDDDQNTTTQDVAKRRVARRRKYEEMSRMLESERLTVLESLSVQPSTMKRYKKVLAVFEAWTASIGGSVEEPSQLDELLTTYFESRFLDGHHSSDGEFLLASVLCLLRPQRHGPTCLPRSLRALKGWRKTTRRPLRRTLSFPALAGLVCRLVANGQWHMGVYALISFGNYYRPSENLSLLKENILPPVRSVSSHWSFLTFPNNKIETSKTGDIDVSVTWDVKDLQWLANVFPKLTKGRGEDRVWPFDYRDLVREFHTAGRQIALEWVVPYTLRHAGPSWDRLHDKRSLGEVQKRGQWKTVKSLNRYERHGRVQADELKFPKDLRDHFSLCGSLLEAVVLGRAQPPQPPLHL